MLIQLTIRSFQIILLEKLISVNPRFQETWDMQSVASTREKMRCDQNTEELIAKPLFLKYFKENARVPAHLHVPRSTVSKYILKSQVSYTTLVKPY